MSWQGYNTALQFRKAMVKLIDSRITAARPNPRIGEVYNYDFSTMVGSVLFRGATEPIRVRFGRGQEPIRKKLDAVDASAPGDIVRVGGKAGAYYALQMLDHGASGSSDPGGSATTGYHYYPVNYGGVGDGVTNDTQALHDCVDACVAGGGGTVDLRHPLLGANAVYCLDDSLDIPAYVDLIGSGGAFAGTSGSTIKLTSATARVRFLGRGGMSYGVKIDGDGTGDPNGILTYDLALHRIFLSISSVRGAGIGTYVTGSQNCYWGGCDTAENEIGLVLDNGAGGNTWIRCEAVGNTIMDLKVTESVGGPVTYPWPSHNDFIHCIFECYIPTVERIALLEAGTTRFTSCGFASNAGTDVTSGELITLDGSALPVSVEFNSCLIIGTTGESYAGIVADGISKINFSGDNYFQYLGDAMRSKSTSVLGEIYGRMNYFTVTTKINEETAGDLLNWNTEWNIPATFKIDPKFTTAFSVKQAADTGVRSYVDTAGAYVLTGDGSGFTAKAKFSYSVTDDGGQFTGGVRISNGFARGSATQTIPVSTPGAVTLDTKTSSNHRIVLNANCTGITLTNATDGKQISITTKQNSVGGWTVVYPTNARFEGAAPGAGAADTRTTVHLEYDSVAGLWCEYMARVVDVPTV